jgi:hypothetical protein
MTECPCCNEMFAEDVSQTYCVECIENCDGVEDN